MKFSPMKESAKNLEVQTPAATSATEDEDLLWSWCGFRGSAHETLPILQEASLTTAKYLIGSSIRSRVKEWFHREDSKSTSNWVAYWKRNWARESQQE